MSRHQQHTESLRLSISEAQGAEKRALKQDLTYAESNLEQQKTALQYLATDEALAYNHHLMQQVYFLNSASLPQRQALLGDDGLFRAYPDGGLALELFISRANDMLRMMRVEGQ